MYPKSFNRKWQWLTYTAAAIAMLSLTNCSSSSNQPNAPLFASNTLGVNHVPPMCSINAPAGKMVNAGLGEIALCIESVNGTPNPFGVVTLFAPPTNMQANLTGTKFPFYSTQMLPIPNMINIQAITDVITFEVPAFFDYDLTLQYNEFGVYNPSIPTNHTDCSNFDVPGAHLCRKFRSIRHLAAGTIPLAGTSTDSQLTFPPIATADPKCLDFNFTH